jgi:uncharacterized protein YecE (DUF72 family)
LNGVFYRTPTPEAVKSWHDQTGKDFVFAWKASKFITHWKRLSENSVNSIELLEDRLSLLDSKIGPILFQLPPNFKVDADRLGNFFKMLPNKRRYSFEFRDPSWYAPRILRMLTKQNISLCLSDHHDAPAPWKRTAGFKDALRSGGVNEDVNDALTGHSGGNPVARRYGWKEMVRRFGFANLNAAVEKVQYPGLDLSALHWAVVQGRAAR